MTRIHVAFVAVAFALAACAQPEPEPVTVQPAYDKIGNASCPANYRLAVTESGETVCQPL